MARLIAIWVGTYCRGDTGKDPRITSNFVSRVSVKVAKFPFLKTRKKNIIKDNYYKREFYPICGALTHEDSVFEISLFYPNFPK